MKIQSTTTKSVAQKKKATTSSTSSFSALFAEQTDNTESQVTPDSTAQPHEQSNQGSKQPDLLESHLQHLEETMARLAHDTDAQEQALHTINDMKDALYQSNLSPEDLQEADTLLRVESKRLESLKTYK